MATRVLCVVVVLALFSSTHGFDHNVVPACAPEEDVCVFDWKIDYIETMIYFEEQGGGGEPVVVRNGSIFRRAGCDEYIPINSSEGNNARPYRNVVEYNEREKNMCSVCNSKLGTNNRTNSLFFT